MAVSKYAENLFYNMNEAIKSARTIDMNDPEAVRALNEYRSNPTGKLPQWFTKKGPSVWKVGPKQYVQIHSPNDSYMRHMNYLRKSNGQYN